MSVVQDPAVVAEGGLPWPEEAQKRDGVTVEGGLDKIWAIFEREFVAPSHQKEDLVQTQYERVRRQHMQKYLKELRACRRRLPLEKEDAGTTLSGNPKDNKMERANPMTPILKKSCFHCMKSQSYRKSGRMSIHKKMIYGMVTKMGLMMDPMKKI
eukprot:5817471-Amphidinium_carterae.1